MYGPGTDSLFIKPYINLLGSTTGKVLSLLIIISKYIPLVDYVLKFLFVIDNKLTDKLSH